MTGHITIYGGIGSGLGEVSLKYVKAQIDDQKSASEYIVHIFTPGGDVFEGYGIYNALKNTGKKITTQIEGICASIGTLIAFAGEEIIMNRTSEFMIHNPQISDLKGDSRDLRAAADQLDKIKNILVDVAFARATRNGKAISKEELWKLYDNETWLNAQETQQLGFADEVVDAIKAVAKINLTTLKMEKNQSWLSAFFKGFVKQATIKNEFTETLADGRVIVVMSDDENWTGKQVATETGEPLEPGEYPMTSGKTLVIGEGSTVAEVKAAPAAEDTTKNQEMDNKIKELEAQLAEAKQAKASAEASAQQAQTEATQAKAQVAKIENKVSDLEKKFLKLQEDAGKTVGDTTEPPVGPVIKNVNDVVTVDPMLEFFKRNLKARSGE